MICKRCLIDGKVQGVFYRSSAYEKAQLVGVKGWVRNLSDGRVEVLIQGNEGQVEEMMDWLWKGSSYSRVSSVQCYDEIPIATDTFSVTRQD
jgi:acylphosphatase